MKSSHRAVSPIAFLMALAGAAPLAAQEGPPPPAPLAPVPFPEYESRTLSNGAELIVVENQEQPVVSVNLRIRSGSAHDPAGGEGLAGFTASLLDKGTETRSAREIAEAIDFIGAALSASAGDDWTSVTATSLTEFLDTALVLMADVVRNPTFPEEEIETERQRTVSGLQVQLSQPQSVASRQFLRGLYGDHPYGNLITVESAKALERADLVEFHRAHYVPENALFVVAGAITADEAARRLEEHFGGWRSGQPPELGPAAPPQRTDRVIRLYHKPGSVQAVARVGHLMPPATEPDWVTLDVALRILGGGSQGWLFQVLREEKGYTYGAYANANRRNLRGYFQAGAEVRNEVTDSAMTELLRLLNRIRNEPAPESDLQLAVDYITGSFPRSIETPQQVANQVATARLRGLPEEYLETYRSRVADVDAADVQRVAREHLHPERSLVVVVGDATEINQALTPFGTVELYDVEGNPLTLDALEVRASTVELDASTLEPMTLVYDINFQGNTIGRSTTTIAREELDGRTVIRASEEASGGAFSTNQELVFTESFRGVRVRSEQQVGGRSMVVELTAEDGTISGSVTGMAGEKQAVNAEVVEGTLLPGMDSYAIWLADLAPGRELELPAFNPGTRRGYMLRFEVMGDTTLTVGAGTYEAYEVHVTGGQADVTVFARAEAPHIVLRQKPATQPVVVELAEIR